MAVCHQTTLMHAHTHTHTHAHSCAASVVNIIGFLGAFYQIIPSTHTCNTEPLIMTCTSDARTAGLLHEATQHRHTEGIVRADHAELRRVYHLHHRLLPRRLHQRCAQCLTGHRRPLGDTEQAIYQYYHIYMYMYPIDKSSEYVHTVPQYMYLDVHKFIWCWLSYS